MTSPNAALDLIEELQLRQWARQNYVAETERSDRWHAVILDEMHLKDFERGESTDHGAAVVPLQETRQLRIDGAHSLEKSSRKSSHPSETRSEFHYS